MVYNGQNNSLSDNDKDKLDSVIDTLKKQYQDKGFLTYNLISDIIPESLLEPKSLDYIYLELKARHIPVDDTIPDEQTLLSRELRDSDSEESETTPNANIKEATTTYEAPDDFARRYMGEMSAWKLLNKKSEAKIASRIEQGTDLTQETMVPFIVEKFIREYDRAADQNMNLGHLITGFAEDLKNMVAANANSDEVNEIDFNDLIAESDVVTDRDTEKQEQSATEPEKANTENDSDEGNSAKTEGEESNTDSKTEGETDEEK